MSNSTINIAVILSAQGRMAQQIAAMVNASTGSLQKFKAVSDKMISFGVKSVAAGAATAVPVLAVAKAYADIEQSNNNMKAALLLLAPPFNQQQLADLNRYTPQSIALYGTSKAANQDMVTEMLHNGATVKDILGGMGAGVQQLAVAFNIAPVEAAQFASRMQRDMGIAAKEMPAFMDNINRLHMIGVGKTGSEAVTEMSAAYSKLGLAASVLGPNAQGLKGAQQAGAAMGIFIKRGFSGELVGTNFYKILMGMTHADKMKKVNEELYGMTKDRRQLNFFDEKGQFAGYVNMVGQLNKLKGLTVSQISTVLKPFANKSGPIAGILASLSEHGTEDFKANQLAMLHKPLLTDINKMVMSGTNKQAEVTQNKATAAAADMGRSFNEDLKSLFTNAG